MFVLDAGKPEILCPPFFLASAKRRTPNFDIYTKYAVAVPVAVDI